LQKVPEQAPHSWGFLFVGGWVDFSKFAKIYQKLVKIKELIVPVRFCVRFVCKFIKFIICCIISRKRNNQWDN